MPASCLIDDWVLHWKEIYNNFTAEEKLHQKIFAWWRRELRAAGGDFCMWETFFL